MTELRLAAAHSLADLARTLLAVSQCQEHLQTGWITHLLQEQGDLGSERYREFPAVHDRRLSPNRLGGRHCPKLLFRPRERKHHPIDFIGSLPGFPAIRSRMTGRIMRVSNL